MISVHIADSYKMLVEGLTFLINNSGIANVTGTSFHFSDCREALALRTTDVLILGLDLHYGNCIDFCAELKILYPDLKIIIITANNDYELKKLVLKNGINGYILKTAMTEELIAGIETVINGELFFCNEENTFNNKKSDDKIHLTKREKDILRLIVEGYTNSEISKALFLGVETVKTYRKKIISKVGAKNSMMLVKIAIEKKLL